jgi:fructose-specific phosphotransferase system IIA component
MKLQDFLKEENIHLGLDCADKQTFFRDALEILKAQAWVSDPARVMEDLEMRESIMSTGVGLGVAIPHAQSDGVSRIHLSLWHPSRALDFNSVDKVPVDLIFMILGPREDSSEHVKILARISRMLHREDFRTRIREASSSAEVLEIVRIFDDS